MTTESLLRSLTTPGTKNKLQFPRELLYERIDKRVDAMIAAGLVDEVRGLLDAGFGTALENMRVIGYNEVMSFLAGEISLDDAVTLIKRNSHMYVRRQANWFKPSDPDIHWLNAQDPALFKNALDLVQSQFGITPGR